MEENKFYDPTCIVTGKSSGLHMHALRNEKGEMVGWIFVNKAINFDSPITKLGIKNQLKEIYQSIKVED
jgi:hypothetical protein